jgi:holliday junction DNA helicase RuvA
MFNALSGTIAGKRFDTLLLDQNGLEWEISVPAICIDEFGRIGQKTRVLTWLQHREEQMKLFGFPDEATRAFFLELIKVDGIGPRQAMKILSGVSVGELTLALEQEDLAGFERAPGVGKKTAQKIMLALKGKIVAPGDEMTTDLGPEPELVRALADMGYDAKKAQECVGRLAKGLDSQKKQLSAEDREKELFRQAIIALSGER